MTPSIRHRFYDPVTITGPSPLKGVCPLHFANPDRETFIPLLHAYVSYMGRFPGCASEFPDKPDTVSTSAVVIRCDLDPVYFGVAWFYLKSHGRVKRDGRLVPWRCDASHLSATTLSHDCRKPVVELTSQPALAKLGMDTDKMYVRLLRLGLGHKANQERDNLTVFLHGKTRILKVLEKESGKHIGHTPASPPMIDHADDGPVVLFTDVAQLHTNPSSCTCIQNSLNALRRLSCEPGHQRLPGHLADMTLLANRRSSAPMTPQTMRVHACCHVNADV